MCSSAAEPRESEKDGVLDRGGDSFKAVNDELLYPIFNYIFDERLKATQDGKICWNWDKTFREIGEKIDF